MYIAVWQEFVDKAKQLYCEQPQRTRYVWKYRSVDNEIVLRVTDDHVVYQYKTSLSHELKIMEAWNLIMLKLCTSKKPDAHAVMQEIGRTRKHLANEETKLEREQQAQKQAGSKKGAGGKQKK